MSVLPPWDDTYLALHAQVEADVAIQTANAQSMYGPTWTVEREDLNTDSILTDATADPAAPASVTMHIFVERTVESGSPQEVTLPDPQERFVMVGNPVVQTGDICVSTTTGARVRLTTITVRAGYLEGTWAWA